MSGFLRGIAIGAGAMYLLDPDRGRRRRAIVRDKVVRGVHVAEDAVGTAGRDLKNRASGLAADARHLLTNESVPENVIVARVRTAIGRTVARPHRVHVDCDRGEVMLTGAVFESELPHLMATVRSVRGVNGVISRLAVAEGDPPANLQPEHTRRATPAGRLLMGVGGVAAIVYGIRRGGFLGIVTRASGVGTLIRATTGMNLKRLTGVGAGTEAIELHKTVNVHLPPAQVYAFWRRLENLPQFMRHLTTVEDLGNGRSRWTAAGPAGMRGQWEAEITADIPGELIEWRSVHGSPIANQGRVRFLPNRVGGTAVEIHLHYNPVVGAIGHAFASLFGTGARQALDEDLIRLKSILEDGRTTVDGRKVGREKLS